MNMRILVIFALIAIIFSLGSALYFAFREPGSSNRTVRALTIRVAISFGLFLLLMIGYWTGLIPQKL